MEPSLVNTLEECEWVSSRFCYTDGQTSNTTTTNQVDICVTGTPFGGVNVGTAKH